MVKLLSRPIDIAVLVYFRFFAGLLIALEMVNSLRIGKLNEYVVPKFHFTYLFFEWLRPWPYWGMVLLYGAITASGLLAAFGTYYRISSVVLFLGTTLFFLMEMSEYINHHYLYCLAAFWLMLLPLGRKELKSTAPAWYLYILLFHIGLAYFFGGVAKLNADWLRGTPMDIYLRERAHLPLGTLYAHPWAPLVFSWGGILFDLLIVPALIWKKTRAAALAIAGLFHLSNVLMFGLGTFPWFSFLMSTMFLAPSWPRNIPGMGFLLPRDNGEDPPALSRPAAALLGLYVAVHLLIPFRHFLYPGNTSWTEQGHMFAWRMMLRFKTGEAVFWTVNRKDGSSNLIDPDLYLTRRQKYDLLGNPDMMIQFARFVKDEYKKQGKDVGVYGSSRISLNGRRPQEMIRPGTDLSAKRRGLGPYDWILPLSEGVLEGEPAAEPGIAQGHEVQ